MPEKLKLVLWVTGGIIVGEAALIAILVGIVQAVQR